MALRLRICRNLTYVTPAHISFLHYKKSLYKRNHKNSPRSGGELKPFLSFIYYFAKISKILSDTSLAFSILSPAIRAASAYKISA